MKNNDYIIARIMQAHTRTIEHIRQAISGKILYTIDLCEECGTSWPCPTMYAITKEKRLPDRAEQIAEILNDDGWTCGHHDPLPLRECVDCWGLQSSTALHIYATDTGDDV